MSDAPESAGRPPNVPLQIWKERSGRWTGNKRLWLEPGQPEAVSTATAKVGISEDERHVEIDYTWLFRDRRQTAVITALLRGNGKAEVKWSDTFHTSGAAMPFRGRVAANGVISVRGAYEDEWSWRIDLDPTGARSFRLAMYNVNPEKKEELAVEIIFRRDGE